MSANRYCHAITSAIFAAAATQAHANVAIHLKSEMASQSAKDFAKAQLSRFGNAGIVDGHAIVLGETMRLDDKPLKLDIKHLLAALEGADSTIQNLFNPETAGGCYVNCYNNCHGSRSWR